MLEARDRLRHILRTAPAADHAWDARPDSMDGPWDALLAAFVAHEFEEVGRPEPTWTRDRRPARDWVLDTSRLTPAEVRAQTPSWLAERRLFVSPRDLVTAL